MKKNLLIQIVLLFFCCNGIFAQNEIRGIIVDIHDVPIIGATIQIKGTGQGTISDENGNFSLLIPKGNNTLIVSYVGYKTIEVEAIPKMKIVLEQDIELLNEVVVIGYGTQIKKDLTGSVGNVSQSKMENNATASIGHNLQGKIAGVSVYQNDGTPYGGTTIRIRGTGSFGATSDPLIVIDGMITNGGLDNLNPNDVESITVLKDASSAAIYGSRGANGVVIVTTKKGNFETPLKVNFSTYASTDDLRYEIPTLTAKQYATQVNDYYAAANLPIPYTDDEIKSFGKGTNWIDEITHRGFKQNYSLNITGGSQKNSYAASMNFYKGEGVIKNTDFTRGNVKLSNDLRLLPTLKLGIDLNVNYGISNNTDWGQAIDRALIYPPTVPPYDENGGYAVCSHAGEPITMLQPLIAVDLWTYDQKWKKFLGSTFLEWDIIKGLKFKTSFYTEYQNWYQDHFVPSYSFGPKGLISDHPIAELYVDSNDNLNYEWDNILTYEKSFNQNHNLSAMAGYTFQQTDASWIWAKRTDFLNNDKNMQVLDAGTSNISNSGNKSCWAIQSYLGRINYDYKRRYLLSASVRVDQTSRISKDSRTGIFPGTSAGWVISEEDFMKDIPIISYFKIRGSWGILGNQEIGIYPYQTTLNSSDLYYPFGDGNEGTTYTGVGPTTLGNPHLIWEKTSSYGMGLDANFFDNRLTFVADVYKRNTSDILVQVPILATSGVDNFPYQNAGSCTNSGVELSLGYSNKVDKQAFMYDISFNWAYNKNNVTKIPSPIVNSFTRTEVGHAINEWYGYVQEGIFQTQNEIDQSPKQPNAQPGDIKFRDLNGDKIIDSNDQKFLGHSVAPHTFGGNGSLAYKNFDLSFSFYGQIGGLQTIDAPGFAITRGGEQTSAWMYLQRWTGPNTSNYVPRVVAGDPNDNYRRSSFWLRSTDFFRLQNLQLGYDFSKLLTGESAKTLQKLRLYIASQNLFCINSFPGFDPEQRVDGYPIPRSFFVGINLGF